jgi:isopentenyl diphosphate isomerase/L-lactate dehydrogenase-like FMN-dependent dehydrogenase
VLKLIDADMRIAMTLGGAARIADIGRANLVR